MKAHFLVIFLLLAPIALGLNIDLSINKVFEANTRYFLYNNSGTNYFSGEVLNSGSTAYDIRTRLDISDKNKTVFTAWSNKKDLMPGGVFPFVLFWLPESNGSYTARLRVYYGGEINETLLNITAPKIETTDSYEYWQGFREKVFKLVKMGYDRLNSKEYKDSEEPDIRFETKNPVIFFCMYTLFK